MIKDILVAYVHGQHGTLQTGHKLLQMLQEGVSLHQIIVEQHLEIKHTSQFLELFQSIHHIYQLYKENDIHILSIVDEQYPNCLLNCSHPPLVLFYKGDISLLKMKKLGVIAHDNLSLYGERILSEMIVSLPPSVFTGSLLFKTSATLFDSLISTQHKCVIMLSTSFEHYNPLKHIFLQKKLEKTGLVLTELPLECSKVQTLQRIGELVAGISSCLCMIESAKYTLAMYTAYCGIEQNKDIIVAPTPLFQEQVQGNHQLLQQGAYYLLNQQDIIDCLNQSRI
ncbi:MULTISPECIES: DNA-processing protein DprA [unclassified Granulicatella]|uniref:DNA-processing protein DprA n=1 Tax=unclassified Granulicatella TaxID=2630493 RepID=UPI001073207F|nr:MULTISPECIES: DNA-processing protein DprA [unclassified Granulicatella]MBF0779908.1 DNA-protecting protein DprA [Granulicatella sp. 19428wC4_WM01]TFU96019.1 DNA-processing protein DprA [Granulicatella sp. WM01]